MNQPISYYIMITNRHMVPLNANTLIPMFVVIALALIPPFLRELALVSAIGLFVIVLVAYTLLIIKQYTDEKHIIATECSTDGIEEKQEVPISKDFTNVFESVETRNDE